MSNHGAQISQEDFDLISRVRGPKSGSSPSAGCAAPLNLTLDMIEANRSAGAQCGHGALAAWMGCPVLEAIVRWFGMPLSKTWVNMPDMEAAMRKAALRWAVRGRIWPSDGLAMIQWTGPWTRPNVPPRVACRYRHWVARRGAWIWDANLEEWTSAEEWEKFAAELMPAKSDGWVVARGYDLQRHNR